MRTVSVDIAVDLPVSAVAERFHAMFCVAARKSLLSWREVPGQQADVLVIDQCCDRPGDQRLATCVMYVGNGDCSALQRSPWMTRLKPNYTLADLIDALDRAAVFMLDWKSRQVAAARGEPAPAPRQTRRESAYQLVSWVSPGAPFNTPQCVKAMALMSREPVTLRQLCHHAGLEVERARMLLVMLADRGVLQTAAESRPPKRPAPPPPVSRGLLSRLARWVMDGGAR